MASAKDTQHAEWLDDHAMVDVSTEDLTALIQSIESSQLSKTSSLPQLPAEILLLVLETVPIDYILDLRLVCRGFRDAIDGRVLYHHLHRTELVGLIDPETFDKRIPLNKDQKHMLSVVTASFRGLANVTCPCHAGNQAPNGSIWDKPYANFEIDESWYKAFRDAVGAYPNDYSALQSLGGQWLRSVNKMRLAIPEDAFGSLRWCIRLDHAVLDLAIPLEGPPSEMNFGIVVRISKRTVSVKWKDMLFGFLKTERALRRKLDMSIDGPSTYSPAEDCLRELRRQRLNAALDLDNKTDRHIKWALRLLRPLFGKPDPSHSSTLQETEDRAVGTLMLMRRSAAMAAEEKAYRVQLNQDRQTMEKELEELINKFDKFKSHFQPQIPFSLEVHVSTGENVSPDPASWPDDLRATIDERVRKWKTQRTVMQQMLALLVSSNEALETPEGGFEVKIALVA